jgi:hypothetical protein
MDGVDLRRVPERGRVEVEEVAPDVPSDTRVVRLNYRVEEPGDAASICMNIVTGVETLDGGTDEQLPDDERQAEDDLIMLLMQHLEFATVIKNAVRECGRAGYTLRATYIQVAQMVEELRLARKKDGMLRIASVLATGAVGGVATGLLFGNPVGLAVGAIVGIVGHFTPWGVLPVFARVDRDIAAEMQGLFGN